MGNTIGIAPGVHSPAELHMSNGGTCVLLDVLALSGVRAARTPQEKRLIVWLSEHDQSRWGLGAVGFDLCELPWDPGSFQADRAFLLRTIQGAKKRTGWERLDYTPAEELLFPWLDQLSALLTGLDESQIQPGCLEEWLAESDPGDPVLCGFPICPIHRTLLTVFGCHLCNNGAHGPG